MSSGDTALSDLVAQCLALIEDGVETVPFDEICASHPHLEAEVKESVRMATQLPELHLAGPGVDSRIRSVIGDRYMVRERVGSGAMGVVYAATDMDLGREVALKVMQTGIIQHSTALARFEREASALAAVQHESIVTIYDRGITEDGMSFLVMELVDGVPCSDILDLARAREVFDDDSSWLTKECGITGLAEASFLRQVMRWTAEVASGLAAAHAAGVVHRDVKPSNIIIRPDGRAVLLDFGIAAKEDQDKLTQTGATVGTPAYMAPEALMGRPEAMPSQDVYGLAATLYHFLTLEAPYRGGAHEVLSAIATREPTPAVKVRPGLPRDAQAILDHGLARDPASRYASLGAMESDIRALLDYRPVSVRPTGTPTRVWRRVKRSRMAIGALAATAIGVSLLGFQQWRERDFDKRGVAYGVHWEQVPANLGFVGLGNRSIADEEARQEVHSILNGLVSTGRHEVTARAVRAAFRVDNGDQDGAVADMRWIANEVDTPFARALAANFDPATITAKAPSGIRFDALPPAETIDDQYLYAYQLMRELRFKGATTALASKELAQHRHARELKLVMELDKIPALAKDWQSGREELEVAVSSLEDAARDMMSSDGFSGATALHAIASARLLSFDYPGSLTIAEEALALATHSHVVLKNAGIAASRLEEFERARGYFEVCLGLTPTYARMQELYAQSEAAAGNFDRAQEILASLKPDPSEAGQERHLYAQILVEIQRALSFMDSDQEAATAIAKRALARCDGFPKDSARRKRSERRLNGISDQDKPALLRLVLIDLCRDPTNARLLRLSLRLAGGDLNADCQGLVIEWMRRLSMVRFSKSDR